MFVFLFFLPYFFVSLTIFIFVMAFKKQKKTTRKKKTKLVGNNNIYTKEEQAKMMKDLAMTHWDGPYPEDDFEVKKPTEYKKYEVPKEKKKVNLSKRDVILFALLDEPRCRKGRIR